MKFKYITEAKADQQRMIDVFGDKLGNQFLDNRKNFKSPQNDIYYWIDKSPEELKSFLDNNLTKNQKIESDLDNILKMPEANDVEKVAEQNGYTIYKINTPEASVKYGLVVGGKAGWCISGGYYDGKHEGGVLAEARHYFNKYLNTTYTGYFFVIGHGTKYAICARKNEEPDIWSMDNERVEIIYGLDKLEYKNVVIYNKSREFTITEDGVLIKFVNINNKSEIIIPNNVIGILQAFSGQSEIKSVIIPEGVEWIGMWAFADCDNLTHIELPNSVTKLTNGAFENCNKLTSIIIPNSVKQIDNAFDGCNNLVINCYSGSYAEEYAKENGLKYEIIDSNESLNRKIIMIERQIKQLKEQLYHHEV